MSLVVGLAVVVLLGVLVHTGRKVGDRIAYGSAQPPAGDATAEAQYDRKRGDVSGPGGM